MTAFSLRARLHLSVSSNRALSLPQSRLCIFWARQLPPQREPRRLPPHATELQKCEPRLSPPTAGCPHPSRCSAKAQHRATFPKGKVRRLPPQSADIAAAVPPQAEQKLFFQKEKAFPRINSRFLLHRGVYSVIIHLIIRKMRRKDYLYERKEKTPRRPL